MAPACSKGWAPLFFGKLFVDCEEQNGYQRQELSKRRAAVQPGRACAAALQDMAQMEHAPGAARRLIP